MKLESSLVQPAAENLAQLMAASNAGEANVVFQDERGHISACIIIAEGQKAVDVMEMLGNLEQLWDEKPQDQDEDCECVRHGTDGTGEC